MLLGVRSGKSIFCLPNQLLEARPLGNNIGPFLERFWGGSQHSLDVEMAGDEIFASSLAAIISCSLEPVSQFESYTLLN